MMELDDMRRRAAGLSGTGRQLLGFADSVIAAAAICGLLMWVFGPREPRRYEPPCSTITLSTPDGKPCFPKHHDRSRVRPPVNGGRDEGAR